jgi:hypothetical protein
MASQKSSTLAPERIVRAERGPHYRVRLRTHTVNAHNGAGRKGVQAEIGGESAYTKDLSIESQLLATPALYK